MQDVKDLIPWRVTDISIRPFDEFWSFNPSIHFDGTLWRCVLRCCDYAMPAGRTIRSKSARPTGQQTKNAMVILDPKSWKPIQVFKMNEKDALPRASTPHVGYEDMRLFQTDKGGLQGIAASLHLKRDHRTIEGMPQHQPPEQVVLSFDTNYDIVSARPIRNAKWSGMPQKNWVPFDQCAEPRFLYSIDKGVMFDDHGTLVGDAARVTPSQRARPVASNVVFTPPEAVHLDDPEPRDHMEDQPLHPKQPEQRRPLMIRGGDVRIVRGGRLKVDAMSTRPASRSPSTSSKPGTSRTDASTRVMGGGRRLGPSYDGLRGGTQLLRIGDDAWLGIGHQMKFVNSKKMYWHTFYSVDSRGKLIAASPPCKLASEGIEFAAGMAIDGDRVVVSFGVDDMHSRLGETSLSAVLEILKPLAR